MHKLTEKQIQLLDLLIELNDFEGLQHRELKTLSGRSLYYQLAKSILDDRKKHSFLKQRIGRLSERSLRNRMRDFEATQLLERQPDVLDARTRKLVPTKKFVDMVEQHLNFCQKKLESRFFLIEKPQENSIVTSCIC